MGKWLGSNYNVARVWAAQSQYEGRAYSMNFQGTILRSYNEPIANIIEGGVCLHNPDRFSVTTSRHQCYADRCAGAAGLRQFFVPNILESIDHQRNMRWFYGELRETADRFWRAVYSPESPRDTYFGILGQLQDYAEFFGLEVDPLAGYELKGQKAARKIKECKDRLTELRNRPQWGDVQLPKWLAYLNDNELKPAMIKKIRNAQVRAEFVKKVGIEVIVHKLGVAVDKQGDYELLLLDFGFKNRDGSARLVPYLKMLNPSVPELWHVEGVHPLCRTIQDAIMFRRYGEDYFEQKDNRWILTNDPQKKSEAASGLPLWEPEKLT